MATAAVIALDETRQAFAKTRARQELHAQTASAFAIHWWGVKTTLPKPHKS